MAFKTVNTSIVMTVGPLIDDADFKTLEESIAYNAAGMDISLIVEKTDGTTAVTAITLTTGGTSDWTHQDGGYYEVEITNTQNSEEGIGYLRGVCDGVLPFGSVSYDIVTTLPTVSAITDAVWDEMMWAHNTSGTLGFGLYHLYQNQGFWATATGFATAAEIATVDANVDAILVDTGTTLPDTLTSMRGSGFVTGTDSLEAIRNRGDAAWITGGGGAAPTVEEIRQEMDANSTRLGYIPSDLGSVATAAQDNTAHGAGSWEGGSGAPTVQEIRTEMDNNSVDLNAILADTNELQGNQGDWATATGFATATALTTHDGKLDTVDANVDAILVDTGTTLPATLTSISGSGFLTGTDSLEAIRNRGDDAWTTGAGGSSPTVQEIRQEMDNNSTRLSAIETDTTGINGDAMRGTDSAALASALTTHDGKLDTVDTNVDSILVDTDNLQANQGNWATATGFATATALATHDGNLDTVDTNVDSILTDTDELQTNQSNWLTATGFATSGALTIHDGKLDTVDTNVDAILIDTGTTLPTTLTDMSGSGFLTGTDSLEAIRNRGDDAWITGGGGAAPTVEEIRTEMDNNSTRLSAIETYTGTNIPADISALNDITVADIIAGVSDGTLDLQEMIRIILAATGGKSSGGGTDTLTFQDAADTKARITATVDANGNRTDMVLDGA